MLGKELGDCPEPQGLGTSRNAGVWVGMSITLSSRRSASLSSAPRGAHLYIHTCAITTATATKPVHLSAKSPASSGLPRKNQPIEKMPTERPTEAQTCVQEGYRPCCSTKKDANEVNRGQGQSETCTVLLTYFTVKVQRYHRISYHAGDMVRKIIAQMLLKDHGQTNYTGAC